MTMVLVLATYMKSNHRNLIIPDKDLCQVDRPFQSIDYSMRWRFFGL
jgi:hypothetical protein